MSIAERVLDLIFPPHCAFCARIGTRGVCPACEAALPRMQHAVREGAGFGRCAVPLRYEGAVREAILRFKFRGVQSAAVGFGAVLARCAAEELGGTFDVVTWAPVSDRRRKRRGYDQARLLAEETAKAWDAKPVAMLRKRVDNPPQSGLDASARRGNVIGVYEALRGAPIRDARILLIDDIVTTGSTLSACVRVLREAGAKSVVCACLASADTQTHRAETGKTLYT